MRDDLSPLSPPPPPTSPPTGSPDDNWQLKARNANSSVSLYQQNVELRATIFGEKKKQKKKKWEKKKKKKKKKKKSSEAD